MRKQGVSEGIDAFGDFMCIHRCNFRLGGEGIEEIGTCISWDNSDYYKKSSNQEDDALHTGKELGISWSLKLSSLLLQFAMHKHFRSTCQMTDLQRTELLRDPLPSVDC